MFNHLSKKGFTLIELLVVVIILGLLVAIGMPSYMTSLETTKAREAITLARQWQAGRAIYVAENGDYPGVGQLSLRNIGLEGGWEGGVTTFTTNHFFVDLRNMGNIDVAHIVLHENHYLIYATDNDLFCCWKNEGASKYKKVCQNLVSNNSDESTFSYANDNYTCYTFDEVD